MSRKLTYLDTGVLMALAQAENVLFSEAYDMVNDPERDFVMSDILRLELLPYAHYGNKEIEIQIYEDFFSRVMEIISTTSEKVAAALILACTLGLAAADAIHLQTAIDVKADEFVTTEKQTKPFFRLAHPTMVVTSIHRTA